MKEKITRIFGTSRWAVLFTLIFSMAVFSCRDFVEIDPPDSSLVGATVFDDDAAAVSAVSGIYFQMVRYSNGGFCTGTESVAWMGGLYADELTNYAGQDKRKEFFENDLTPGNSILYNALWSDMYSYIYVANSIIEGLSNSVNVTAETQAQLTGEAKFIRAFCFFYLVNLFGDVPLAITTNYLENNTLTRVAAATVYEQIIADLLAAQTLLSTDYQVADKIRPNKATATALLARVYLFLEEWGKAEAAATSLIDDGRFALETDLNDVFLIESTESIWHLQAIVEPFNTHDGFWFILTRGPSGSSGVSLTEDFIGALEDGDLRADQWVGVNGEYYYPYKYKVRFLFSGPPQEYLVVFRLAEQYLIRAEARARLNDLPGSQSDLNEIRGRAGLDDTEAVEMSTLLNAIYAERRAELFTEWGHRWLDLKRTGLASEVLAPLKPEWQDTDINFPIPESDLNINQNLTQNEGYN